MDPWWMTNGPLVPGTLPSDGQVMATLTLCPLPLLFGPSAGLFSLNTTVTVVLMSSSGPEVQHSQGVRCPRRFNLWGCQNGGMLAKGKAAPTVSLTLRHCIGWQCDNCSRLLLSPGRSGSSE